MILLVYVIGSNAKEFVPGLGMPGQSIAKFFLDATRSRMQLDLDIWHLSDVFPIPFYPTPLIQGHTHQASSNAVSSAV